MKIVLWIGKEPNQIALAHKIASKYELVGVVFEQKITKRKKSLIYLFERIIIRLFLSKIPKTWFRLMNHYDEKFPQDLKSKSITVENINDKLVKEFTESLNVDIICVSGTRLVRKENLLTKSKKGMLNLHTGLSPHVKGGPNCTNWCLVKGWYHLIGNTIMWIDEGIDTGNLVLVERVNLKTAKSFFDVHLLVMEHAHELYLKALGLIERGEAKSIPQNEVTEGVTFYNKDWNIQANWQLLKAIRKLEKSKNIFT